MKYKHDIVNVYMMKGNDMDKFVVLELKTCTETVDGEEVTKETAVQVGHSVVDETEARSRAEAAARRNPSGVYAVAQVMNTVSIPVAWGK